MKSDGIGRWLRFGMALMLCLGASGRGGANPSGATVAGVVATLDRYFDALRQSDLEGVRATMAPDYDYDRGRPEFDPADPFDQFLGLRYTSLVARIETLTTVGNTATVTVTTSFQGNLNLEPIGMGRPLVQGEHRLALELQPRGGPWRLTAVRPVRRTCVTPESAARTLFGYTVNGRTSLAVPPETPLTMAGTANFADEVFVVIGSRAPQRMALSFESDEPWRLQTLAPEAPGRYLAYAYTFNFDLDDAGERTALLDHDLVTIPVTVVRPR